MTTAERARETAAEFFAGGRVCLDRGAQSDLVDMISAALEAERRAAEALAVAAACAFCVSGAPLLPERASKEPNRFHDLGDCHVLCTAEAIRRAFSVDAGEEKPACDCLAYRYNLGRTDKVLPHALNCASVDAGGK